MKNERITKPELPPAEKKEVTDTATRQLMIDGESFSDLTPGQRTILMMFRAGLAQSEIARELGKSVQYVSQTLKKLDKRGFKLTSSDLIRKAVMAVDKHLQGEKCGEVTPTASSQIAAAQMVLDRDQPRTLNVVNTVISINAALEAAKVRDSQVEETDYLDVTPLTDNVEVGDEGD